MYQLVRNADGQLQLDVVMDITADTEKSTIAATAEDPADDGEAAAGQPHLIHDFNANLQHEKVNNAEINAVLTPHGLKLKKYPAAKFTDREVDQLKKNIIAIMNMPHIELFWSGDPPHPLIYQKVLMGIMGVHAGKDGKEGDHFWSRTMILGKQMEIKKPDRCPHRAVYYRLGKYLPQRTLRNIFDYCREHLCCLKNDKSNITDEDIKSVVFYAQRMVPSAEGEGNLVPEYTRSAIGLQLLMTRRHLDYILDTLLTPAFTVAIDKKHHPFTLKEDIIIVTAIKEELCLQRIADYEPNRGMLWAPVAKLLSGRSTTDCKKRFYDNIRKMDAAELAFFDRSDPLVALYKDMAKVVYYYGRQYQTGRTRNMFELRDKLGTVAGRHVWRLRNDLLVVPAAAVSSPNEQETMGVEDRKWLRLYEKYLAVLITESGLTIEQLREWYE
jgi:hypothetical protein